MRRGEQTTRSFGHEHYARICSLAVVQVVKETRDFPILWQVMTVQLDHKHVDAHRLEIDCFENS